MSNRNEIFYECGPDDEFEEIESEEVDCKKTVSFIPDDAQGRVLQQAFSVCPKSDNETLKERYNRLRSELILLNERIDYENQKSKELKHQQVGGLQTYLTALKCGPLNSSNAEVVDTKAQRLAALNNRIKDLEWTLGIAEGEEPSSSVLPLLKTLDDLKVRISILSPDLLSRINKRIQENNHESKSARSDTSNEQLSLARDDKNGIAEMHELIARWDSSCKKLPDIISHLTASRQLHEDAERVCQKYAQLMSLKDDIEKSLQFQQKFDELNSKNNAERIESIKQRIGSSSA